MMFEELERHELERVKFSAFKVCDEFTSRIDGVPKLNELMTPHTSLPKSELSFNNKEYFKKHLKQQLQLKNVYFQVITIFQCYRILLTHILKFKLEKNTLNFYDPLE